MLDKKPLVTMALLFSAITASGCTLEEPVSSHQTTNRAPKESAMQAMHNQEIEAANREVSKNYSEYKLGNYGSVVNEFTPKSNPTYTCVVIYTLENLEMQCLPKVKEP